MTLVRSPSDVDDSAMAVDQTTSHVNLPRKRQIRPPPRYSHLNSAARGPNTQNDSASTAELGKLKKKRVANETSPANLQGVSSGGTNIETPKSETTHSDSSLDSGSSESIPNIDTPNGTTIRNMSDLNDQKVFGGKKQAKPVVKPKIVCQVCSIHCSKSAINHVHVSVNKIYIIFTFFRNSRQQKSFHPSRHSRKCRMILSITT